MSEELVPVEASMPLVPMSMGQSFHAYKALQSEIDKAMPDCIITIQGRQFRKKNYWRAVRAAFSLKVWCVSEERIEANGDWGYSALYRAEAKNGMSADGDGVCMATEKGERQRTIHNVRSHCHTRAFNRAVSNLVGFGEVSAEEVERDDPPEHAHKPAATPASGRVAPADAIPFDPAPDAEGKDAPEPGLPEGVTYVSEVIKAKEDRVKGWTLWVVKFADGRSASTFSAEIAGSCQASQAMKDPIIPTFETNPKDRTKLNLVGIVRAT